MRAAPADDPAIEGLRGLAALLVLATHYSRFLTPEPGLWGYASTGVDLFFVLSGYVFAPYLLGRPLPLRAHLVRRAFRLYPLYLVALLTYALLLPEPARWQHFGVHLLMAHTLQSTAIAFHYNPAFWSLPPEVEFYLALPLLAWLARRRPGPALLPAALLLHLLLVLAAAPGDPPDSPRVIASVHLPGLLVEFLLGAAAAALAGRWPGRPRGRLLLAAAAVLGLGLWVFQRHVLGAAPGTVPPWAGGNIGLLAAAAYALLVAALAGAGHGVGHGVG
ncbi:MAG: acyltransferase, partial [Rhodoferax sp.]|nr:acyltransferase [Rhodoferax sp.]